MELTAVPVVGDSRTNIANLQENFCYLKESEYPENDGPLMCCSCTNNCRNTRKCACRRRTYTLAQIEILKAGYPEMLENNKLLYSNSGKLDISHHFGIFECNDKCKCNLDRSKCLNRVAQRPLKSKLQIYDTRKVGFGLRCLKNISKGEFIGTYTGRVISATEINKEDRNPFYDFGLVSNRTYKHLWNCLSKSTITRYAKAEERNKVNKGIKTDNVFTTLKTFAENRITEFAEDYLMDASCAGNPTRFMNVSL